VSLWLRHLLRKYRDQNGCLPSEQDFCEEPSSEDGVPPNTPCRLCRLTDAVLKDPPDELQWRGEDAGVLTAAVGKDAVATVQDEGDRWTWRIEDDDGTVIGNGEARTLSSALYGCEREVYEQGVNA
jgi:hypothetical protein